MKISKPSSAQEFWRTLEEKQGANLDELVGDEFASRLPDAFDTVERRSFLKLMGASLALAGMAGCTRQPPEQIVPYVRQPENVVPGRPLYYATAMTLGGRATGLLVESHEGRPTKIEGNPSHPASLGAVVARASDWRPPGARQTECLSSCTRRRFRCRAVCRSRLQRCGQLPAPRSSVSLTPPPSQ